MTAKELVSQLESAGWYRERQKGVRTPYSSTIASLGG